MNNRIENLLSHVVILEERLNLRPSDVADQRHRDELIRYVAIPPFLFDSYSLLASLIPSSNDCNSFMGIRDRPYSLAALKMVKMYPSLSKTFQRQCFIIRFIHNPRINALSSTDEDSR